MTMASASGKLGGKNAYCSYCYHKDILKLADPLKDMQAGLKRIVAALKPAERKRLATYLSGGGKLLVGPDYHARHAVYKGVPSIETVASGQKFGSDTTRADYSAKETRVGEVLCVPTSDLDAYMISHYIRVMTTAEMADVLVTGRKTRAKRKASPTTKPKTKKVSPTFSLDDLF